MIIKTHIHKTHIYKITNGLRFPKDKLGAQHCRHKTMQRSRMFKEGAFANILSE